MFLDTSLFPPDVEYKLNDEYGETKFGRKQVQVYVGVEMFAVVNSDFYEDKWNEPKFVILRAVMPSHEIEVLSDIATKVQQIMKVIATADKDAMEKLPK